MDFKDYQILKNSEQAHFWYAARLVLIENILKNLDLDKNCQILNIGCGVGEETLLLQRFGKTVAVDINPEAVAIARQRGLEAKVLDIEKDDINKNFYDVICCFDVLEHLSDDKKTLQKIKESLKPGGYFIFTVPAGPFLFSTHDMAMGHFRRYSRKDIISKLKSDFIESKTFYWNVTLYPLEASFRLFKKISYKFYHKKNANTDIKINLGWAETLIKIILIIEAKIFF